MKVREIIKNETKFIKEIDDKNHISAKIGSNKHREPSKPRW